MHIFGFFIVGFSSPICHDSETVSGLSVACTSAELQSVSQRHPNRHPHQQTQFEPDKTYGFIRKIPYVSQKISDSGMFWMENDL